MGEFDANPVASPSMLREVHRGKYLTPEQTQALVRALDREKDQTARRRWCCSPSPSRAQRGATGDVGKVDLDRCWTRSSRPQRSGASGAGGYAPQQQADPLCMTKREDAPASPYGSFFDRRCHELRHRRIGQGEIFGGKQCPNVDLPMISPFCRLRASQPFDRVNGFPVSRRSQKAHNGLPEGLGLGLSCWSDLPRLRQPSGHRRGRNSMGDFIASMVVRFNCLIGNAEITLCGS